METQEIIDRYQLQSHPEGGWYAETYRSELMIPDTALPAGFSGERPASTAIYFLLEQGNFSAFHRIRSDECWHFYAGGTLLVHVLYKNGEVETIRLGSGKGERFQYVVPAGAWFASEPAAETSFSFVGCTVAPGFDFRDFEMARADELTRQFPEQASLIRRLCR